MKPDWHDRPTEPGLWLRVIPGTKTVSGHLVRDDECDPDVWTKGSRWLGPLPPDTKEEK